jgi:hypothetical protein
MIQIENNALALRKINPLLDIKIICPGVIYGSYGFDFYDIFKHAWL